MIRIRITAGTYSRIEDSQRKTYREGDTLEVTERTAGILACEPAETPAVPPAAEPAEVSHIDSLRSRAALLGVEFKPEWNAAKLEKEIARHDATDD